MDEMELIPSSLTDSTLESYLGKVTSRSKVIYWIIIGFVAFGLVTLPLLYVDISVQTRGFFQSEIEKQFIYAPFQGKVVFTAIKNGREVNKGDTLFIIDAETIRTQVEAVVIEYLAIILRFMIWKSLFWMSTLILVMGLRIFLQRGTMLNFQI